MFVFLQLDENQSHVGTHRENSRSQCVLDGAHSAIYSLVLFMLGIIGVFKKLPNRKVVLAISIVGLIIATIYMLTIPMPTDFSFTSYFKG